MIGKFHFKAVLFSVAFCLQQGDVYACTAGIVHGNATGDGRPLHFKVRDTSLAQQRFGFSTSDKYSFMGIYSVGGDMTTGLNEAGLVVASTRSRVDGEEDEVYFRNGECTRHLLANYERVAEVDAFFQRQLEYGTEEFDQYISGNFPIVDSAGDAVLYEVYKPDLYVNTALPVVYTYDTTNRNRTAQGLLNMVPRTGFFHMNTDGTDDIDSGQRYESARTNMVGLFDELGELDIKTLIQGNISEEGVQIIGLEMGVGGSRRPGATAYFAPPSTPVSLVNNSDIIRLTAKYTPQDTLSSETDGFRMVLAQSGTSRMIEDGLSDVILTGYMVSHNPVSGSYRFQCRENISGDAVSSLSNWTILDTHSGQLTMQKDVASTATVEIERLSSGAVEIRFTMDNGSSSRTVSYTDNEHVFTDFDTVALGWPADSYGLVQIEEIQVRSPFGVGLLGDTVRWYQTEHVNISTRPIEAAPGNFEVVRYGPVRHLRAISKYSSMSTMITQGILPDENPALTTAWVMLGNPNYTIAVPAWVRMGDQIAEPLESGLIWNRARSLYLKGLDVPEIQAITFPVEEHLIDTVNNIFLPHWRDEGVPASTEMARVHRQMADDAYSLLVCLDDIRVDNQAPVIGPIEVDSEPGSPTVQFSASANDPDGAIASYQWEFGDGTTATNSSPEYTYGTSGWYLVSCTVTDNENVSVTSWYYFQSADADGDGLPDEWEQEHFGGDIDPSVLSSNGVNSLIEAYVAGLDPNDPDASFELASLTGNNLLGWNAITGRVYTIYWSSNLLSTFQTLETNFTGGAFTDFTHGVEGTGFYKIDVQME